MSEQNYRFPPDTTWPDFSWPWTSCYGLPKRCPSRRKDNRWHRAGGGRDESRPFDVSTSPKAAAVLRVDPETVRGWIERRANCALPMLSYRRPGRDGGSAGKPLEEFLAGRENLSSGHRAKKKAIERRASSALKQSPATPTMPSRAKRSIVTWILVQSPEKRQTELATAGADFTRPPPGGRGGLPRPEEAHKCGEPRQAKAPCPQAPGRVLGDNFRGLMHRPRSRRGLPNHWAWRSRPDFRMEHRRAAVAGGTQADGDRRWPTGFKIMPFSRHRRLAPQDQVDAARP